MWVDLEVGDDGGVGDEGDVSAAGLLAVQLVAVWAVQVVV